MTATVLTRKIGEVEKKIVDVSSLVTSTVINTKIGEVVKKIPDISGLVKKTIHNAEISGIVAKHFTTSDYNKSTRQIIKTKIKETCLVDKSSVSNLVKNSNWNTKLAILATKT